MDLLESEEEGEFLLEDSEEPIVGPEPLVLEGKGDIRDHLRSLEGLVEGPQAPSFSEILRSGNPLAEVGQTFKRLYLAD